MDITEEKKKTLRCCFTGHRPEKLSISEKEAKYILHNAILNAITNEGKRTFISGMARGIDIWAAEEVLEIKKEFPDVKLIAAIPYSGFETRWSENWKNRYENILKQADYIKVVNPKYSKDCFQKRNEWMVDHSSLVLALWNGEPSGTKNTIDYANKQKVIVRNLWKEIKKI